MKESMKFLVLVFVLFYFVAPDPVPGPIDDAIIAIIGLTLRAKLTDNSNLPKE